MKNKRHTELLFIDKYMNKGIQWDGYVVRVVLNDEDSMMSLHHAASILIKMNQND